MCWSDYFAPFNTSFSAFHYLSLFDKQLDLPCWNYWSWASGLELWLEFLLCFSISSSTKMELWSCLWMPYKIVGKYSYKVKCLWEVVSIPFFTLALPSIIAQGDDSSFCDTLRILPLSPIVWRGLVVFLSLWKSVSPLDIAIKRSRFSQTPVVHACNPSYSGGRDQEDCSSRQPRQIVLETQTQKIPS
jgi:hypothetical protein